MGGPPGDPAGRPGHRGRGLHGRGRPGAAGIANAVATLGTATTPDHVKKLLRASDKVIFSFDDGAGRRAAWRALQACLPVLRDDIAIRFLFLPAEHDPDSYVRELGAEAFRACLGEAVALSRFLLDELASRHNMDEAEGRASCLHEAKPLLAAIPECALRVRSSARWLLVQLTPEEMAQVLAQQPAKPFGAPAAAKAQPATPPTGSSDRIRASWMGAMTSPAMTFTTFRRKSPITPITAFSRRPWRARRCARRSAGRPASPGMEAQGRLERQGRLEGKGNWKGRREDDVGGFEGRRTMPSLAKRLLGLLLAHPELVDSMGDQQRSDRPRPHLGLVRDLIMLAQSSGARHVGALLEAAEPDSDLATVLRACARTCCRRRICPIPRPNGTTPCGASSSTRPALEMAAGRGRAGDGRGAQALHGAESAHDGAERCRHTLNTLKSRVFRTGCG